MGISSDRILYSDPHLLVVNKLSGELVVRGKGEVGKLPLLDFLKKDYPGLRAIHRLDFETSGCVVFAKTKEVLESVLKSEFRGWSKIYRTLVSGRIPKASGTISFPLPARGEKAKLIPAETNYKVIERFVNSTYVEAEIHTGRHHQIRRHFERLGYPLVLDDLYGSAKYNRVFIQEFGYKKFFLHAWSLAFPHPVTGERVRVEASLPKPFKDVIAKLQSASR